MRKLIPYSHWNVGATFRIDPDRTGRIKATQQAIPCRVLRISWDSFNGCSIYHVDDGLDLRSFRLHESGGYNICCDERGDPV